ncbi:kelch domain-containing protein 1-like isoform X2 [Sinocyclocheilus grahami]|uniref:kelch domain-containing protein 1-like isoform X2 n=1 Tax=Sinocyclocheilus grahami TaxID=75366 RepID=UPI0007AD5A44|nr:PREDICTED: kelch domain-containing protein 1-like isoform X2 [Sinocyclocheilus grahami]
MSILSGAEQQQLSASVMGSIEEPAVVTAQRSPVSPRSDHISFLEGHNLYVWGGCQMYCVDLLGVEYSWKKVTDTVGGTPSPRVRHSCWVYKNRLIYFGGYGCKTVREVNNSKSFMVDETSRVTIGSDIFQFWGWNNEVHMFEPVTATWTEPQTQGQPPEPRSSHASTTLGHKGYICGGLEMQMIDIHCLDLVTWTWTQIEHQTTSFPWGRTLHTLTAISDDTLFLFGGLSTSGDVLSDGWEFNTKTRDWREKDHAHKDKPRLWHSADKGRDSDVVIFGGSQTYLFVMDSVAVLRSPSQNHCADVLVFQTQPYSLSRLCEDCIGKHIFSVQEQASWLPAKLQKTIGKRISYFRANAQNIDAGSLVHKGGP